MPADPILDQLYDRRSSHATDHRHSKDDALSATEFEYLLEASRQMREYYGQEGPFLVLVAGRLGLRRGEIAHMRRSWIDWHDSTISIPSHQSCEKGDTGGPCGYCRKLARDRYDYLRDRVQDDDVDLTIGDLPPEADFVADYWRPKTTAGARDVYFGFSARVELAIERFFDAHTEWHRSVQAINRRVLRATELAPELEAGAITPHGLRATAASRMAGRGLKPHALQQHFGWSDISTAEVYVATSADRTRQQLDGIHSR